MDPSLYTQWVQHPQLLPDSPQHVQHVQHDARSSSSLADDWSKDRATPTTQAAPASSSHNSTTTLDISDFTTLGDIGGEILAFQGHMQRVLIAFLSVVGFIIIVGGFSDAVLFRFFSA